jgi:hypothetical protein
MQTELLGRIDREFDPTDSNAASEVVEKALKLMEIAARALRDVEVRMGRDNAEKMSVALMETAHAMGLLPYHWNSAQEEELLKELCRPS